MNYYCSILCFVSLYNDSISTLLYNPYISLILLSILASSHHGSKTNHQFEDLSGGCPLFENLGLHFNVYSICLSAYNLYSW